MDAPLYYPVTEPEMRQIQHDCKYPDRGCEECDGYTNVGCRHSADNLIDEIITRNMFSKFIEDLPKPQRCDNACVNKGCYFHPDVGTKEHGLDIDYPITIPTFIRRFGCASYNNVPNLPEKHDTTIRNNAMIEVLDLWKVWMAYADITPEQYSSGMDKIESVIKSLREQLQKEK